jgi:hypothetical protein
MKRAPNLDAAAIKSVVEVLDGWAGKLTWELLIDAVESKIRVKYTRQALHNHVRIAQAFKLRKKGLAGAPDDEPIARKTSVEMQTALARIARLEAENTRLSAENERLLIQFAVWMYNAECRGVSKEQLNASLPTAHRQPTVFGKRDRRSKQ